ncbi:MAG: ABC transporter substrate-binding protein [Proteobacteria bacterium]|nr:ABC transporter substrate-binding protein [Pseudomonadota bacterium]
MMKLARWALALTFLFATTQAADAVTRGGKLVYARYADSLFLDPVLNDANVDIWILTNLYDTVLFPSADGKGVTPGLASAYTVSPDGKTFTLTLRPGLKFADGSPLTSADVKFSLDRARNPKNGVWSFTLESIDSVEASSTETVVLKLKQPDPTLAAALATFNAAILPEKAFNAAPGATDADKAKVFAEKPLGSGPFMLTEWQRNSFMVLKRNPNYWQNGEDGKPLPYLDEIRFETIPDDATRILKLKAGEVDGAEFIPYARAAELKSTPGINMELFPSTRVAYLTMNVRPKLKDGTDNPLADTRVRQALNMAVDKDAIVKVVLFGNGKPTRSFMSSSTPMVTGEAPVYPYNVAKAKELLKEAGKDGGFDVSVMALAGNADDAANLQAIQQMWAQVGVRLKIDLLDSATRTARYRAADFQMRTSAWTDDINDPSEIASYFAYFPTIESLHGGYRDTRVDELFEKSQHEIDAAKRAAMYKEIQEIYAKAAPIVFLYESPYPVALRSHVKGFIQIPLGNNIFAAAYIQK